MATPLNQLWQETYARIQTELPDSAGDIWLDHLRVISYERDTLTLAAPDRICGWVKLRFHVLIERIASEVFQSPLDLVVLRESEAAELNERRRSSPSPFDNALRPTENAAFNPKYTFEQFVIGENNHAAHAAALTVAERPSEAFNPLFIYGAPGLGKTHLLHSIGNFLTISETGLAVSYMTAETFAVTFQTQLRNGGMAEFKRRIRDVDVLLVDDVQFLENKTKTEEEFFHNFNFLYDAGKQLVISSDRLPSQMPALAQRLRDRFESGLLVDISAPAIPLRVAILKKRVTQDSLAIDDDSLLAIAKRVPANIRTLEGALVRVIAFSSLNREPVTPQLVNRVLDKLYPQPAEQNCSVQQIQDLVSARFGITCEQLVSPARDRTVSYPRQLAMYLACTLTNASIPSVAASFNRDHSTVIYARNKVTNALDSDSKLAQHAKELSTQATTLGV